MSSARRIREKVGGVSLTLSLLARVTLRFCSGHKFSDEMMHRANSFLWEHGLKVDGSVSGEEEGEVKAAGAARM